MPICELGTASLIPYPLNVVGFPVVILLQSNDGISIAASEVPPVTKPLASYVIFVLVPPTISAFLVTLVPILVETVVAKLALDSLCSH